MDAAVGTLKFENKAVIPTDPRTKLFFDCNCQHNYDYRRHGRVYESGSPVPYGVPDCIPAPFKKMGGSSQICSYIRYFVCVGINGITTAHGHMEFYLGSRSRDLYAHAPRIYHGILSGEYDNGQ